MRWSKLLGGRGRRNDPWSEAMLTLEGGRVTNPETLSLDRVTRALRDRDQLVVQFSNAEYYSPKMLEVLNEASRLAQGRLQVRFFSHYGTTQFDAAVLRHLPEVTDLAVDCMHEIAHEDEIGRLEHLTRLSWGVFDLDRPDFLETIDLARLNRLSLGENRRRNLDLSPLARGRSLEVLWIEGHHKGSRALAGLSRLHDLTLRVYGKRNPLDFIASLPALGKLQLILGGRADLDDLSSDTITLLDIVRVQGLTTLGELARLPALTALRVEDQPRLTELDLSGAQLEILWLYNCKALAALPGLDDQRRLREFSASLVRLDLEALRDRAWPPTMRSVNLFSGSQKWNDAAKAALTARGYGAERSYPW